MKMIKRPSLCRKLLLAVSILFVSLTLTSCPSGVLNSKIQLYNQKIGSFFPIDING